MNTRAAGHPGKGPEHPRSAARPPSCMRNKQSRPGRGKLAPGRAVTGAGSRVGCGPSAHLPEWPTGMSWASIFGCIFGYTCALLWKVASVLALRGRGGALAWSRQSGRGAAPWTPRLQPARAGRPKLAAT